MDYPFVPLKRKLFKKLVKEPARQTLFKEEHYNGCTRGLLRWGMQQGRQMGLNSENNQKKKKKGIDTKEQGGGQWMENY